MRLTRYAKSPALWLAPLVVALCVYYAHGLGSETDFYPLREWTRGLSTVFLAGPVAAACAAWDVARMRVGGAFDIPSARSRVVVLTDLLWPVFVLACLEVLVGGVSRAGLTPPPASVLPVAAAAIAAQIALGTALGAYLRPATATAVALFTSYAWMVLPSAGEPLWLRHLNGAWMSCCQIQHDIAARAVLAALTVNVALIAAAVLLTSELPRRVATASTVGVLVVGVVGGAIAAAPLGADPVGPRQATMSCSATEPQVCLWPEHTKELATVTAVAAEASGAWRAAGITVPNRFTESLPGPDTASFGIVTGASRDEIVMSLADSLLPPWPACAEVAGYPAYPASNRARLWLAQLAGVRTTPQDLGFDERDITAVRRVQSAPVEQQREWFEAARTALAGCDRPAPAEPTA